MKAFKVIFQHGKIYDVETKKRIYIAEGATTTLVLEDNHVMDFDPYNQERQISVEENLLQEIENKKKLGKLYAFKKIASAGDKVNFQIKAGKKDKGGNYAVSHIFSLVLLQDLYMIQTTAYQEYGIVYPCACIVESAIPEIRYFEKIHAYSLNDAYMKTYDWYFAHYGKPTTNIYQHFSLAEGDEQKHFAQLRMFS